MAVIVAKCRLVRNAHSVFPTAAMDAPIVFDERLLIFHQRQQRVVRESSEFREVARQIRDLQFCNGES
jgi:hypothetical protein